MRNECDSSDAELFGGKCGRESKDVVHDDRRLKLELVRLAAIHRRRNRGIRRERSVHRGKDRELRCGVEADVSVGDR